MQKVNNPLIETTTENLPVGDEGDLFVKVLRGPARSGRTAIYIHGGGSGGNHTLIERPSRHLINEGFFDTVILPDRRGDGASSPLSEPAPILHHAADMKALLDQLGIAGPVTAMGISYGGPIALALAHLDRRVERVVLVASSPTLSQVSGSTRFLLKTGLLRRILKLSMSMNLGKLPPAYVDYDPAYDARKTTDLVRIFTEGLKRTPRSQMDSMIFAVEATLNPALSELPEDVRLSIPVIQIIGERDEVWGANPPGFYRGRFPQFRQYRVPGGKIHKDVFLKADPFFNKLLEALRKELPAAPTRAPEAAVSAAQPS